MAPADPAVVWSILIGSAFLPPIIYMVYLRNVERYQREPWGPLLRVFFYGAILSVIVALLLEQLFQTQFVREYDIEQPRLDHLFLLAVVAAPIIEEFAKALGLRGVRRHMDEIEDGIIYGATAGLGFSATENLVYSFAAYDEGQGYGFAVVAAVRSVTACFLHATATGIVGFGMSRAWKEHRSSFEILPYYALAVLLHALFNAVAIFQIEELPILSILLIFVISFGAIRWTVQRIRRFDLKTGPGPAWGRW